MCQGTGRGGGLFIFLQPKCKSKNVSGRMENKMSAFKVYALNFAILYILIQNQLRVLAIDSARMEVYLDFISRTQTPQQNISSSLGLILSVLTNRLLTLIRKK